jgi:FkbM family methyltransferase
MDIFRRKDLQPADIAMGEGPFLIRFSRHVKPFKIFGKGAISGVREMYVRDTYLRCGRLRIADGDTVVDLGANMGNFTNLALAHGEHVRVVAVEPSDMMNAVFNRSVSLNNGHIDRVVLIRAFVGTGVDKHNNLVTQDAAYMDAPWMSEKEIIESGKLSTINFLKCDIEGGEFGLLNKNSKLLSITQKLAIEVHAFAGDVNKFLRELEQSGFIFLCQDWASDGLCTVLAERKRVA